MPKVSAKRTIYAKNEPLGLLERITLTNPHQFDDVAKRRKVYKPYHKKIIHHPFDPELAAEGQREIERKALLRYLFTKLSLLDHISEPSPLLITCLSPAHPEYVAPLSVPDIHFCQTKIFEHVKDYNVMFAAAADRLELLFEHVEREGQGLSEDVKAKLKVMGDGFDNLYHGLEEKVHHITNKEWRLIKHNMKKISKVSFSSMSSCFSDICKEIAELELTFVYAH